MPIQSFSIRVTPGFAVWGDEYICIDDISSLRILAKKLETSSKEAWETSAKRLTSCYNACNGMEDPIAEVRNLRSALQEAHSALNITRANAAYFKMNVAPADKALALIDLVLGYTPPNPASAESKE